MRNIYKKILKELQRFENKIRKRFIPEYNLPVEKNLLNGKNLAKSKKQSIIFFTTHKCASTFLEKIIEIIAYETDYLWANLETYFVNIKKIPFPEWINNNKHLKKQIFHSKGYLYGPLRVFQDISNLDKYKIVLLLRDPRDVLVSHYYSVAYSHPIIFDKAQKGREEALKLSLDDYVLNLVDRFLDRYNDYKKLLKKENVLYLKYEDMIESPEDFLNQIQEFTNVKFPEKVINDILNNDLKLPEIEDKYKHKRSGKSGQYKEKLQAETIKILNEKFADIIKEFGFDKEPVC